MRKPGPSRWWLLVALAIAFAMVSGAATAAITAAGTEPVVAGGRMPEAPAISGSVTVWADRSGGSYDIVAFDAATGESCAVASSPADELQPAISGDTVVYVSNASGGSDIYAYDMSTGQTRLVCGESGDQVNPSVWGDIVVWEDYRTGYNPGIYGYDLAGGYEFYVESGYNKPKRRPQVVGSLIVWEDYSNQAIGRLDADVRVLDLATSQRYTVAGTTANEMVPATDGRYIVWAQAAVGGLDLHGYDTAVGETFTVRRQAGEQSWPTIGDGTVYWLDNSVSQGVHVDAFSIPARKALAFDSRGVGEIAGIDAQGGSITWLERNGSRWQVRARPAVAPQLAAVSFGAPAAAWSPLRVRAAVTPDSGPVAAGLERDAHPREAAEVAPGSQPGLEPPTASGSRSSVLPASFKLAEAGVGVQDVFAQDTAVPSAPSRPGARPDGLSNVLVSWTAAVDNVGVTEYRVFRSRWVTDTPTQVAVVGGSVTTATFAAAAGERTPAKYTYYYAIRAYDASANASAFSAMVTPDPHGTYVRGYNVSNCLGCHSVHGATSGGALGAQTAAACYVCHGLTPATDAYGYASTLDSQGNFGDDAVIATSGPSVGGTRWVHRNAYMSAIERECDSCHTPHRRPATTTPEPGLATAYNDLLRTQLTTPAASYRYNTYDAPVGNTFCFDCHGDGATDDASTKIAIIGGSNAYVNAGGDHRTGWASADNLHANTALVAAPNANPAIACEACHDKHGGPADALLGRFDVATGDAFINGRKITSNDNVVCFACHNGAIAYTSQTASGYPDRGAWPGEAVYASAYSTSTHVGSMHGTGTAVPSYSYPGQSFTKGDCKNCHVMHGSANAFDILRGGTTSTPNFSPSTFGHCFECHDSTGPASDDIKRYFPVAAGGTNTGERSGHRTLSAGRLPAGSALPCYDCHNPHGSGSAYGLVVVTQSGGTTITVGDGADELAWSASPTSTQVRRFCFTCHTTSDTTAGWNGAAMAVVTAPAAVEGISRTTYSPTGAHLKLPPVSGHRSTDTESCYTCHGDDYTDADSNNVHNPSGAGSNGGINCFTCHNYQAMQSTSSYHHYVTTDAAGYYPLMSTPGTLGVTSTQRTCLMCHVDHDYFNSSNTSASHTDGVAQNLRSSISSAPSKADAATYVNWDHDPTAADSGGVCVSCHAVQMDKNTTGRKSSTDRFTKTTPITKSQYLYTAHNYVATTDDYTTFSDSSTFTADLSNFNANCSKCHNDDLAKQYQTGPYEFGTHDGTRTALQFDGDQGGFAEDPQEQMCWLCHSRSFETAGPYNPNGGTAYSTGGTGEAADFYNGGVMMSAMQGLAVNLKGVFTNAAIVSKHPIDGDGTTSARVECVSCHNVHKTEFAGGFFGDGVAQDPDNTLSGASLVAGGPVAYYSAPVFNTDNATNRDYCLACHDGAPPVNANNGSVYVPYDVFIPAADETTANPSKRPNKAKWMGRGHANAVSSDTSAGALTINRQCADCHDKHGSTLPSLLGVSNNVTGTPTINGAGVTGNDKSVCYACHDAATTATSRTASGYPMDGTWPGSHVWDTSYDATTHVGAAHSQSTVVWPGRAADYTGGDCKNCHDVHGTANVYDELRTETAAGAEGTYLFDQDTYTFCFNCHDGTPGDDIQRYFPTTVGGTAVQEVSTRFGHRTKTAGVLPAGSALPCYYCHNPHGSATGYGLTVITQTSSSATITVGDAAGELEMTATPTAAAVRGFCMTCHTTYDGVKGWDGSAYATVTAGAKVAGIDRTSAGAKLRLPAANGHRDADTHSCYVCHGQDYSAASSNNVHNPSGGISQGGQRCYTCHGTYKEKMDAAGTEATQTYHHVMGTSTVSYTGDVTTQTLGAYPISTSDLYCISCHADHDGFNDEKGANLRSDIAGTATTNTDFLNSGTFGICVTCHNVAREKDTANQKSDGSTLATVIDGTKFASSSHQYTAASTFSDSSTFRANCSKCHNDEQTKSYQSGNAFGTHFSAERRLLSALGGPVVDPLAQENCFGCHTGGTAGNDYYGARAMTALARSAETQFGLASYHPVDETQSVPGAPGGSVAETLTTTLYASATSDTAGTWTNDANSLGSPDGTSAGSDPSGPFEMWQSFSGFPSDWDDVVDATITVRSQAKGGWGATTGGTTTETVFPDDGAPHANNFTKTGAGNVLNDADDATYYGSTVDGTQGWATVANPTGGGTTLRVWLRARCTGNDNVVIGYYTAGDGAVWNGSTTVINSTANWYSVDFTGSWTAAQLASLEVAFQHSRQGGTDSVEILEAYVEVASGGAPTTFDDQWQIQYSTDSGSSWSDITAATTATESALTSHTLDTLESVLETTNASQFRVRTRAIQQGGSWDNSGTVDWDASTLQITYTKTTVTPGSPGADGARIMCASCHNVHVASSSAKVVDPENTYNTVTYSSVAQKAAYCLKCHDGTGPQATLSGTTYVPTSIASTMSGFAKTGFAAEAHWTVHDSMDASDVKACGDCHENHGSYAPKLLGLYDAASNTNKIGAVTIDANDNDVCYGCHASATANYPARTAADMTAEGYPSQGAWPGKSVFATAYNPANHTGSIHGTDHAGIQWPGTAYATGDCKNCHDVHGTAATYDELRGTAATSAFTSTQFGFCFTCHRSGGTGADVETYYPAAAQGASSDPRAGHKTISAGVLPSGSSVPCYACHDPHGSPSPYGFVVITQTSSATTIAVGDQAGELTYTTAADIREFCFTCHTTSDTTWGWNGSAFATVTAGAKALGIDRTVQPAVGAGSGEHLRLPTVNGHRSVDGQSCLGCHVDPHQPTGGVSEGGNGCYSCHDYSANMDMAGASRTSSYHHVVGTSTVSLTGDIAPKTGAYPTSNQDVYCVSCHTDHNYFNANKGANLRTGIADAGSSTTNTDFFGSGSYGICVSCHTTSRTKDNTNQKSDGRGAVAVIGGAGFAASGHNYTVPTSFGGSTFNANCSKCHNDEQTKEFQTVGDTFSTHWSAERNILNALGGSLTDPLDERLCFECHTPDWAGWEYYGYATINLYAYSVKTEFALPSKHPVDPNAAGSSVQCVNCHNPHTVSTVATSSDPDNTYNALAIGTTYCLRCHDGSPPNAWSVSPSLVPTPVVIGASKVTETNKSTNAARGHWTANGSIGAGETKACNVCHDKHGSNYNKLLGVYNPSTTQNRIEGQALTGNDNSVCYACHTSASTGFPNASRNASGYPMDGTWPGGGVYSNATYGIHDGGTMIWPGSGYVGGDCKNCHDVHGTANTFDETVATFTPAAFNLCFECHDGSPSTRDIKRYFPTSVGGTAVQTAQTRYGHKTLNAGTLPAGSALPCYDCHNPHSSSATDAVQVTTRSNNSTITVGDAAGELDMTTATGVRRFCFTCHATSDTDEGWNGAAWQTLSGTDAVEGILRTSTSARLKLPSFNGHRSTDSQSCYACHGNSYAGPTSNNVHNPSGGVSDGGQQCYTCHSPYQTAMDAAGGSKLLTYHHVVGTSTVTPNGDLAPNTGSYPTSTDDVYCVSCHSDHNYFNAAKGANLRTGIAAAGSSTTNTDFYASGSYGICVSCHSTGRAKDTANQLSSVNSATADATTRTPVISGSRFATSAHEYSVLTSFGSVASDVFGANCSKCHSDEQSKTFQTGAFAFGTHYSKQQRILSAFGGTPTSSTVSENHCLHCHSQVGDTVQGVGKPAAGRDAFGAAGATMDTQAEAAYDNIVYASSSHPVASDKVYCESCHNPHVVSDVATTTDPDNTYNAIAYGTAAQRVAFCLKCHDGTPPTYKSTDAVYVPTNVTMTQPRMDKDGFAARAHWTAYGSISAGEVRSCADCHDNHGSAAPKMLGVYDFSDGTNRIGSVGITANDNSVCYGCHTSASTGYPAAAAPSITASGYPTNGTWPGQTMYATAYSAANHTGSIHGTDHAGIQWPGESYATGDCKNCHDVHGTANTYDELRGTPSTSAYTTSQFGFCFTCHESGGTGADVEGKYPAAAQGTSADTYGRAGHKTLNAGWLPAGSAMPCYACHNPHGTPSPYGLMTVTQTSSGTTITVGDASSEITYTLSSASSVRTYCFTCHTTSDTTWGWNGSAYATVTAGARVYGIDRTNASFRLRLPTANGHASTHTQSCMQCHGDPHEPSGGVSNGGQGCYGCHSEYEDPMDMSGSSKTSYYHHVLGTSTVSPTGDIAPNTGVYPTSNQDVFCVSCHTDHNYFNSAKGANLRTDIAAAGSNTTNTDFINAGSPSYGICVTCHATMRAKDTTNQASSVNSATADAKTGVAAITGQTFALTSHNYEATSTFGGTGSDEFRANCSKCHNDAYGLKQFQTSAFRFGLHFGDERDLLAKLSGPLTDPYGEQFCFRCHSGAGPNDFFGKEPMSATARSTQTLFSYASRHPVETTMTGNVPKIGCENCHNVHRSTTGTKAADPDNTYNGIATSLSKTTFCLKCHDGASPTATLTATTYVPYSVASTMPGFDKSTFGVRAHWTAYGSISAPEVKECGICHDKHGSTHPKLLGAYVSGIGNSVSGMTFSGNNKFFCTLCHGMASTSWPAAAAGSRDASGYPQHGTWPGATVYNTAYNAGTHTGSIHGTDHAGINWPGTSYDSGDCKNCHDVHGTANSYDELRGTPATSAFTASQFGFCFTCHKSGGTGADVQAKYPSAAQGTSVGTRAGHKTLNAGNLPAGSALPCYDCHQPHGSASAYGLMIVTQTSAAVTITVGDGAGEIDLTTDSGVRRFCFSCHTTSNNNNGWTGAVYAAVTAGAKVEGIDRVSTSFRLRLPVANGHASTDTQSCIQCHTDVHEPSGGVSTGGTPCYGCHQDYQDPMDAAGANKTDAYHHVVGTSTVTANGDLAPNTGTYPTSNQDVYCVSCHTDHNYFNSNPGANLRTDIAAAGSNTTNTDFIGSGTYGICVTCHTTVRTKDTANQKSDGTTLAPVISGLKYNSSAHQYSAASSFGASVFRANCSKCHNDEQAKEYQTSTNKFGTHWSAERNILSALGGTPGDPLGAENCYGCHTGATAGNDYYGAASMTQAARRVETQFSKASRHPVDVEFSGGGGSSTVQTLTTTLYASATSDTANTWSSGSNSLGSPDGTSSESTPSGPFEMWQSFSGFPSDWDDVVDATITVRSQARQNGWGRVIPPVSGTPASQVRRPTSDISTTGWSTAPLWSKVDEADPNDGATTQIQCDTSGNTAGFGYSAFSIPSDATNISVTVTYVGQHTGNGGNSLTEQLRVGSTWYSGDANGTAKNSWNTFTYTWTTNPGNGSAAWTVADINGTSGTQLSGFGVGCSDNAPMPYITQAYVTVDYESGGSAGVTNDDQWGIQYSVNSGSSWSDVYAANNTSETALTDHALTTLESVLETTNANLFRVRIRAIQQGGSWDDSGTVDWDASTLQITYTKTVTSGGSGSGYAVVCESCHNPHVVSSGSPVTDPDNTYNTLAYATVAERAAYCIRCHDASTPTSITAAGTYVPVSVTMTQTGMDKTTYAAKAHWTVHDSMASGEVKACGDCHDNHGSAAPKLLGVYQPASDTNAIGGVTIGQNNNDVCYGCHTAATTGYPATGAPSMTASGYPSQGSWPGKAMFATAYSAANHTGSIHGTDHAGIQWPGAAYATGDCKNCHDVHGTANTYDELRGTPSTSAYTTSQFGFCFTCHKAGGTGADVAALYPTTAQGTSTGDRAGHKTISAGILPAGSAVPCYACHQPHGTPSAYGLQIITQTSSAATIVVGDAAAEIDLTTDAGVRRFCFTCHTTSNNTNGWNGGAYALVTAGAKVLGIDRTVQPAVGATTGPHLRLPVVSGHASTDAQNCYGCHSDPHEPSGGGSSGGAQCYACHKWDSQMDDAGATKTSYYHHVMDGTPGDLAPNAGAYPIDNQVLYCVSCHTDHNYFNSNMASNLRQNIGNSDGSAVSNTDFIAGASPYGICASCHSTVRTKDNTNQKSDGRGSVAAIAGADYDVSAHDYAATSSFGDATTFNANCSKCHSDEVVYDKQTSANKFGTHYSAERNILSALGGSLVDPLEEAECYRCHSGDTAGNDYYGVSAMTQAARRIQTVFAKASKHPVVPNGGASVACVNCHNVHENSSSSKVSDPDNTYNAAAYSTVTEKATYCLRCHDGAAPNAWSVTPSLVMTPVVMVQAGMNKSTYATEAHWTVHDSMDSADVKSCADCHDNHGSAAPNLLGVYNSGTNVNAIGATTITLNNNTVCFACHSGAIATKLWATQGYPTQGTWPGQTTYDTAYSTTAHTGSFHGKAASGVVWPGSGYSTGDCKNCHDVHGTANAWDELRGTFSPTNFGTCFECHDGSPATDNIKSKYPVAAGGTSTDSRSGHRTINAGSLPADSATPCYACHNPHGSASAYGLEVNTQISAATTITLGDSAGEINMSNTRTAADVRHFCFTCHTTGDTAKGWNGGAYQAVAVANARVLGIDRYSTSNKLRLTNAAKHNESDTGQSSCLSCHADVHQPTGGGASGGSPCDGCHTETQFRSMYNSSGTKTTYYHHVLESTAVATPGDQAPNTGTYPNSTDTLYCVSCHTDHNYFNATPGANLRQYIGTTDGSLIASSDVLPTSPYGICLSCHGTTRTRDNTNQRSGGAASLVAINGADYIASAHSYDATSSIGGDVFRANCVKCHDDELDTGSRFPSAPKFGTHSSLETTLLAAMGVSVTGNSSYPNLCYKCHSTTNNPNAASFKDYYGAKTMTGTALQVETDFGDTYKHPVARGSHTNNENTSAGWNVGATRHSTCMDCHNVHAARSGVTTLWSSGNASLRAANVAPPISGSLYGVWGVTITGSSNGTWTGSGTYAAPGQPTYTYTASVQYQWQLCLKCHSRYAWDTATTPTVSLDTANQTGQPQSDVGKDFNPVQTSFHPLFKEGRNQPPVGANSNWNSSTSRRLISGTSTNWGLSNNFVDGWLSRSLVVCTDCHANDAATGSNGPHGSANRWILRGKDSGVKVTMVGGSVETPNTNASLGAANYCVNCHRGSIYATSPTLENFSRWSHSQCSGRVNDGATGTYYSHMPAVGCSHCHGGKPGSNGLSSGVVHGTNRATKGFPGTYATSYRMLNGLTWGEGHYYEDTGDGTPDGQTSCTTQGSGSSYSSCAQHPDGGRSASAPNYYYNSYTGP